MTVVSVNLTERGVAELDELKTRMGFVGRSETVRAALRHFADEMAPAHAPEGNVEGILIIIHDHHSREKLDRVFHDNSPLVRTQLHQHLECGKCLDLFILEGPQDGIRVLVNACRRLDSLDHVRFVATGFIEGGKCQGHGGREIGNVRI